LEAERKLKSLEVRLRNARFLEHVSALVDRHRNVCLGPQTELAKKLKEFEDRVRTAERRAAGFRRTPAQNLVDWHGKNRRVNNRKVIERFLAEREATL
jgi:hypothetical protein